MHIWVFALGLTINYISIKSGMVNTREKKSNKCQKTNTNKDQQIYFQSEYALKNKQYSFSYILYRHYILYKQPNLYCRGYTLNKEPKNSFCAFAWPNKSLLPKIFCLGKLFSLLDIMAIIIKQHTTPLPKLIEVCSCMHFDVILDFRNY